MTEQQPKQGDTQEPLIMGQPFQHREGGESFDIFESDNNNVYCEINSDIRDGQYKAQRIVACVNAMQGIENPAEFMEKVKNAVNYFDKPGGEVGLEDWIAFEKTMLCISDDIFPTPNPRKK